MTRCSDRIDKVEEWGRSNILPILSQLPVTAPSYAHCLGATRFLGGLYPEFLREWTPNGLEQRVWDILAELSVTLRCLLVIDDYVRDKGFDRASHPEYTHVTRQLRTLAVDSMRPLISESSAESLMRRSEATIEDAYAGLGKGGVPNIATVLAKCDYVRLPIRMLTRIDSDFAKSGVSRFVRDYFFSLQLVDDFCDVVEDYACPLNHNLFVWDLSTERATRFAERRARTIAYVAYFIEQCLREHRVEHLDASRPLSYSLYSQTESFLRSWSRHAESSRVELLTLPVEYDVYEPIGVDNGGTFALLSSHCYASRQDLDITDFRAETIHEVGSMRAQSKTSCSVFPETVK